MPTYDFECQNCKHQSEIFLSIYERNSIQFCPKCHKLMNRLIGKGSGIIFKGSGFYETDYKRNQNEI